jgi:hypothetical protein
MLRTRRTRGDFLLHAIPRDQWPEQPPAIHVAENKRDAYKKRCNAVDAWMDGQSDQEIFKCSGHTSQAALRLFQRCTRINKVTNKPYGYAGCIPGIRLGDATRTRMRPFKPAATAQGKGMCGALGDLFRRYPDIGKAMRRFVKYRKIEEGTRVSAIQKFKVHQYFLYLCRKYVQDQKAEYPFSTQRKAYKAIREWYEQRRYESPVTTANNEGGAAAARDTAGANYAVSRDTPKRRYLAYERAEMDEHHEDGQFTVHFPVPPYELKPIRTSRVWALALLEVECNLFLSTTVAAGDRYNRPDVLRLIRNAFMPPPRRALLFPNSDWRYMDSAAFPAELPDFRMNRWAEFGYDSDPSHVSPQTIAAIEQVVKCSIHTDRIGDHAARRPIERALREFATADSWSPSATGNNPSSPNRRDSEDEAERRHIDFRLAQDLVDLRARNHNVTSGGASDGLSPLQKAHQLLLEDKAYINKLGSLGPKNLWMLLPCYSATINRTVHKGRLGPLYIELYGAKYSSKGMANSPELAALQGKNVILYVEEDARTAIAVRGDGKEVIGRVAILGRLRDMPHSLIWRRAYWEFVKAQKREGNAHNPHTMIGFLKVIAQLAKTGDKVAALLPELLTFIGAHERGETIPIGGTAEDTYELIQGAAKIAVDDEEPDIPETQLPQPPRTIPGGTESPHGGERRSPGGVIF